MRVSEGSKHGLAEGSAIRVSTVPQSSSEVRDEILSQHSRLRRRLKQIVEIAARVTVSPSSLDDLCEEARNLFEELAVHMETEEAMFPAALRDVIGWGAVLRAQMTDDHERQRADLARARSSLEQRRAAPDALAEGVRAFATRVLADMEEEEQGLLQADLDAISTETEGG